MTARPWLLVSKGKSFPVETVYLGPPGKGFGELEAAAVAAVRRALSDSPGPAGGDVLCFLPVGSGRSCPPATSSTRMLNPRF